MKQDGAVIGAAAGILGAVAKGIIFWFFYLTGIIDYTIEHIFISFILPLKYLHDPLALLVSFIADYTMAVLLGLLLLKIIRSSGTDYVILKGTIFGLGVYVMLFSSFTSLEITKISIDTPIHHLLGIITHVAFGIIASLYIRRALNTGN